MNNLLGRVGLAALALGFATEAMAEEWNVSLWGKRRAFTEHVEKLAELVSDKTNGEFTLNISYGGLSKNTENLDGISIGAFEMAQFCAGYHRDKNPSITVLELPFLGVDSLEQEREISMAVYDHPAVQADLARWNATLVMPSPLPQYNVVGVGVAPESLADFEGFAVRATGGIGVAMAAIGAVPTSMSATEVRQALDSGVVKGVSFAPHAHMSFGTIETGEWWTTNLNPGTVNCPVVVNTDALNGLSDAHREALLGSVDEALDYYIDYYNSNTMERWGPALDERGIERVTFPESELAAFKEAAAGPAAQAWIEENSARGLPAQELYDLVTGMIGQ
ncbi:TRAP-type C4-dicarboxylate transport system substrate-binding protein [Rhodovulum iodosum]|uniref:TRAP-type C4-dicarboxylate transport system substrate-binding protein n=1 Tax=Rhodovulum iodosum TaxID=68291 RepID=A0ABV3XUQ3_9RHOB|nr:C4-dicarboxylate TRAP transporter substrate-binding protein [Rhodovulum robiginosum]RSK35109.1 C4-dicarboxylate ABC transporter substrate-binding protein [Rhodovulum robiginosum]